MLKTQSCIQNDKSFGFLRPIMFLSGATYRANMEMFSKVKLWVSFSVRLLFVLWRGMNISAFTAHQCSPRVLSYICISCFRPLGGTKIAMNTTLSYDRLLNLYQEMLVDCFNIKHTSIKHEVFVSKDQMSLFSSVLVSTNSWGKTGS